MYERENGLKSDDALLWFVSRSAAPHLSPPNCCRYVEDPSLDLSLQFFTCLVILFACEVAAGIWGFVNKDQVRQL